MICARPDVAAVCKNMEVDDFLSKPCEIDELIKKVADLL
jgi:hypothetical protein